MQNRQSGIRYFSTFIIKQTMKESSNRNSFATRGVGNFKHAEKVVPSASLVLLDATGSNITQWSNALSARLRADYSVLGSFIRTGTLYQRTAPSMELIQEKYSFITRQPDQIALLTKLISEHEQQLRRDEVDYVAICSIIEECISQDAWDKCTAEPDFAEAIDSNNPMSLYKIARRVTSLHMTGLTSAEALYAARRRYEAIRMLPGMSLVYYKSSFLLALENLHHLGAPNIPPAEQAKHALGLATGPILLT